MVQSYSLAYYSLQVLLVCLCAWVVSLEFQAKSLEVYIHELELSISSRSQRARVSSALPATGNSISVGSLNTGLLSSAELSSANLQATQCSLSSISSGEVTSARLQVTAFTSQQLYPDSIATTALTTDSMSAGSLSTGTLSTNRLSTTNAVVTQAIVASEELTAQSVSCTVLTGLQSTQVLSAQSFTSSGISATSYFDSTDLIAETLSIGAVSATMVSTASLNVDGQLVSISAEVSGDITSDSLQVDLALSADSMFVTQPVGAVTASSVSAQEVHASVFVGMFSDCYQLTAVGIARCYERKAELAISGFGVCPQNGTLMNFGAFGHSTTEGYQGACAIQNADGSWGRQFDVIVTAFCCPIR